MWSAAECTGWLICFHHWALLHTGFSHGEKTQTFALETAWEPTSLSTTTQIIWVLRTQLQGNVFLEIPSSFFTHTHQELTMGVLSQAFASGKKKKIFVKAAEFRLSLVFLLHTFSHGFSLSWAQGAFAKRGRGGAALIPPLPTHRGRIDISVYLRGRNKQRTACFPARYSNPGFATAFCPCVCNFVKLIIHIVGKIFRWKFFSLLTLDNGIRK